MDMLMSLYQLLEQRGQDVIECLVTDGCVKLLKGFRCRFSDLLQRITQSLPYGGDQRLGEHQNLTDT